ncbi:MAG TPA: hypothetical protein GXX36_02255 [Clostridiaceae bacterium]|nr:hypothetical protein [Clostridiaceae bacterium]
MRRKSKFWAYVFAIVPGAGQMYLGFMKLGVSIMLSFFLVIFAADFFRISLVIALLPVIWCYAFFDTINKAGLEPEELERVEDKNLFEGVFSMNFRLITVRHTWIGAMLIILGAFLLVDKIIINELYRLGFIDTYIVSNYIRTIIIAGAIIWLGIKMISGKKEV